MSIRSPQATHFCDLSETLDRRLRVIGILSNASDPKQIVFDDCLPELGQEILEYLSHRIILEHVFFGRSILQVDFTPEQRDAEIWKLRKLTATRKARAFR